MVSKISFNVGSTILRLPPEQSRARLGGSNYRSPNGLAAAQESPGNARVMFSIPG